MVELLRVEKITKIFGSQKALNEFSYDLNSGEVHCLVGENGAGKSTFIKILSGALRPDSGQIYYMGKEYDHFTPDESMALGISTMYQDVELIETLTVADNIFLGNEITGFGGKIDTSSQNRKAKEIMNRLSISLDETLLVEDLSAAQKQILQIVKALHMQAKVLIMDEPTSSLGQEETKSLMRMIKDLKAGGIGIIYISHYLEEVFEIGDRITVLKDGHYEGTYNSNQITIEEVIRKMVGRDAALFFSRAPVPIGDVKFEIKNFSRHGVVDDVSFKVNGGEIFGIGGLVGAGRTELINLIFGIDKKDSGELFIKGKNEVIKNPSQAINAGICLITEDRKQFALLSDRSVRENIILVSNEVLNKRLIKKKEEIPIVGKMIRKLQIAVSDQEQSVFSLSGGNQQKTVIARWLLSNSDNYIFDEPTKGVDIGAKEEIYKLMVQLASEGKCIIMISSDMPELISMSDRIGVMRNGQMTNILPGKNMKEEELIKYFIGVNEKYGS